MSLSHITSCPAGQMQSSLGCGTTQCCEIMGSGSDSSVTGGTGGTCYPNIYGTCVCFDYNGPTGQNYTFVGICSDGGAIAGVPTIKSCSSTPASLGGKDSCYCRQTVPGDNSMTGSTQVGNWIFGPGGPSDCLVFDSTGASTSSAVASASATSTSVRSGVGRVRVGGFFRGGYIGGLAVAVVLIRMVFGDRY